LDVRQAAEVLGISSEGVRKRIKRGSLESEKDAEGRVYVWLDESQTRSDAGSDEDWTNVRTGSDEAVVEVLREQLSRTWEQLEAEREANRENRRIIAGLVQRVPELEAVQKPRESPVTAPEESDNGRVGAEAQKPSEQRSWLYRFFFGP